MNESLKDRNLSVSVDEDAIELPDFNDGLVFINLIECISGKPFGKYNKAPRFPGMFSYY